MSKSTSERWKWDEEGDLVTSDGTTIVLMAVDNSRVATLADRRKIHAAPEIFEAPKAMLMIFSDGFDPDEPVEVTDARDLVTEVEEGPQ